MAYRTTAPDDVKNSESLFNSPRANVDAYDMRSCARAVREHREGRPVTQLDRKVGDDEKCAKRSHDYAGRTSRINPAKCAVERGRTGRWRSDEPHEMVKTDAGLCIVFLRAIDFEHVQRSSFCETNPTAEQIKAAEELRPYFRRSNLAANAEKSGHQMVCNGQRSAKARSAKRGRRTVDDRVRQGRAAALARSGDNSAAVVGAGELCRSANMPNGQRGLPLASEKSVHSSDTP
jgi:hypothetical protein